MLKNSSRKFGGVKDERRPWKVRRERPTPNEIARKRREREGEERGGNTRTRMGCRWKESERGAREGGLCEEWLLPVAPTISISDTGI